jgi:hypothetical protein
MKRSWPIFGVKDVLESGRWYRSLLGQQQMPPGHADFDIITDDDETVLVALHEWGAHGEGPPLQAPGNEAPGNGALLFSVSTTSKRPWAAPGHSSPDSRRTRRCS